MGTRQETYKIKSFLVLFFKKELLFPFTACGVREPAPGHGEGERRGARPPGRCCKV
jgi:hypothetical protein